MAETLTCPKCGKPVKWIGRGPGWMNSEQWDATKPGEYYCDSPSCHDPEYASGFSYFWTSDLTAVEPHHNAD